LAQFLLDDQESGVGNVARCLLRRRGRWPGSGGAGDEEVGNATVRDPDALVVVAPRFPQQTRRLTVRTCEYDALRRVRSAFLTLTNLRRTRDRDRSWSLCACGWWLLVVR